MGHDGTPGIARYDCILSKQLKLQKMDHIFIADVSQMGIALDTFAASPSAEVAMTFAQEHGQLVTQVVAPRI